jgi:hypothetical protein
MVHDSTCRIAPPPLQAARDVVIERRGDADDLVLLDVELQRAADAAS